MAPADRRQLGVRQTRRPSSPGQNLLSIAPHIRQFLRAATKASAIMLALAVLGCGAPSADTRRPPAAAAACPNYPPVANVGGVSFYSDAAGSQVDPAAMEADRAKQAPIVAFLEYIFESVDGAPPWSRLHGQSAQCANALLQEWAKADALRTTQTEAGAFSRQGAVNRQLLTRGFVFAALKLARTGQPLGEDVRPWLGRLVAANNAAVRRMPVKANLYYWGGATAAVFFLLTQDRDSLNLQNEAWTEGIAAIRNDGYLDAELARGVRALVYHQYALSALLVLRSARQAAGMSVSAEDEHRLRLLADRIGASLCHPAEMARAAGVSREEAPGEWGFRVIAAHGGDVMNENWNRCGVRVHNYFDVANGGDQRKTADMLHAIARETRGAQPRADRRAAFIDSQP